MELRSLENLMEETLSKKEIEELEKEAKSKVKTLNYIRNTIKNMVDDYMKKNNIGFNEMVRKLNSSGTQLRNIRRGKANLTLVSLARILDTLNQPLELKPR